MLVIRGEDETNLSIEEEGLVEVADNLADNNERLLAETFSRVASFIGLRRHQWHTSGR
ncbi:MAG: hypothetical protein VX656_08245 [Candidatus Latescibacterota bacterium]|nr:hypothetical protein [Candidatus Latescibacterota bacterium]